MLLLVLVGAGCAGSRSATVQPPHGGKTPEPTQCRTDGDCIFNPVDCSECGPCPGDQPVAVLRSRVPEIEAECARHPPVRLNPKAGEMGLAFPACSPCPNPGDEQILWRAVCRQGACQVEQAGKQERRRPGSIDLIKEDP